MAKRRRQARIPTPAWERPRGTIGRQLLGRGLQFYGAAAVTVLVVVALGIIAYAFISQELEERGRPGSTALQVEDARFRLDYFSRRLQMFVAENGGLGAGSAQPVTALPAVADLIVLEEIIRRFASELDVTAAEREIQEAIGERISVGPSDATFDVLYQQELARSGLSDEDYRAMVEAFVLSQKLQEKFLERVPAAAESVRYRQIVVGTAEQANEIRDQLENGASFAELAAEHSLDTETRDQGGRVGWIPRGILDASMEELLFALKPGQIDVIPAPAGVFVIEMLEKAENRRVGKEQKERLAEQLLLDWAEEKKRTLAIVNNMDINAGDREKIAWALERAYGTQIQPGGGNGG